MARDPYKYFRIEARELVEQMGHGLLEFERIGSGGDVVPRLLRLAHTLKGASRVVRQPEIADHAHTIEDLLTPFREAVAPVPHQTIEALLALVDDITGRLAGLSAPPPEPVVAGTAAIAPAPVEPEPARVVRADISEIDGLLDGITEVYAQLGALGEVARDAAEARHVAGRLAGQLQSEASRSAGGWTGFGVRSVLQSAQALRGLAESIERGTSRTEERIEREIRQLRDVAEQLRLLPANALFSAFERAVRDAAHALGKEVAFRGRGGDIRVDGHAARLLQDALLQLVRNAVAHGIEPAATRLAAGKRARGEVTVEVVRRGRRIAFRCLDDGAGIDTEALRRAASGKGRPAAELDQLGPDELIHQLLQGGLSTSATVTEVAGRGIGLDIVREVVARLGGELRITTTAGKGACFELSVPVSVSSVEGLLVESSGLRANIPLDAIRATVRIDPAEIEAVPLGDTVRRDGVTMPLLPLARLLGRPPAPRPAGNLTAVIVAVEAGSVALLVDRLLGTGSVVWRTLPPLAPAAAVIAGASFDAAGAPLLMLDPDGLVALAQRIDNRAPIVGASTRPLLVIDDSLTTRMLEQSILESEGYLVDVAVSAEDGLECARRGNYALILVDVEMPGMDGFSFIEHLRRDQRLRSTPAILVTSRDAPEDKRRGREVGAQDYVVKSEFDQRELLDRVRELVAQG